MKDPSIKEWWCTTDIQDSQANGTARVTFEDVDAALEEWQAQSRSNDISGKILWEIQKGPC